MRKDVLRVELKQDAVLKSSEIMQTQYIAMNKKLNDLDFKLSTYSTDLSTLNKKQADVDANYGKVIKIIEKIVSQMKK